MLTCYSPEGFSTVWQQYVFIMYPNPNALETAVELFIKSTQPVNERVASQQMVIRDLEPAQTIPAGTTLFIQLIQEDYVVTGPHSNQ
jgi:hypothetical protein